MNMFQQARFLALVPLLVATALGVAACGGGSSGMPATSQATSQMNQMKLSVADAPPAEVGGIACPTLTAGWG